MLDVLDPGFISTVQDLGRKGYQQYGVSVGGAADSLALQAANGLVGNAREEAALEITLAGPRLQARDRCLIAVTGARFVITIDGKPVPPDTALFVRPFSIVEFGPRRSGARAYLAVCGGFDVPVLLGSRSTNLRGRFGGFRGRRLEPGDRLDQREKVSSYEAAGRMLPDAFRQYYDDDSPLRVVWGPQLEYFPDEARDHLFHSTWELAEQSDRMGARLRGEPIPRRGGELLSCGVTLGAIQVPSDGQPIVLMADRQPTGGYPIIATVIRADIPRLAQKTAGDRISFRPVSVLEAREAWLGIERLLAAILSR
ncbi:MAG: biotin-dependent carboxyltransferase family protein [Rudaea sp.]